MHIYIYNNYYINDIGNMPKDNFLSPASIDIVKNKKNWKKNWLYSYVDLNSFIDNYSIVLNKGDMEFVIFLFFYYTI